MKISQKWRHRVELPRRKDQSCTENNWRLIRHIIQHTALASSYWTTKNKGYGFYWPTLYIWRNSLCWQHKLHFYHSWYSVCEDSVCGAYSKRDRFDLRVATLRFFQIFFCNWSQWSGSSPRTFHAHLQWHQTTTRVSIKVLFEPLTDFTDVLTCIKTIWIRLFTSINTRTIATGWPESGTTLFKCSHL